MKCSLSKLLLSIIFTALPLVFLFAQPDNPGDPDADVPIDGGASLLAAAGVGYGAKKIRDYMKAKKEKQSEENTPGLD